MSASVTVNACHLAVWGCLNQTYLQNSYCCVCFKMSFLSGFILKYPMKETNFCPLQLIKNGSEANKQEVTAYLTFSNALINQNWSGICTPYLILRKHKNASFNHWGHYNKQKCILDNNSMCLL